jgi:hypothetical protein
VIAELRFLGTYALLALGLIAVLAVSLTIGYAAHLNVMATTAVYLVVGCAALIGGMLFFVRRQLRAGPSGVSPFPHNARYAPLLIDLIALGSFTYQLAMVSVALHQGDHVSRDRLIISSALFVWWLVYKIRVIRARLRPADSNVSPFSARKLAALRAAYQQPTRAERRRALAPLRNRGYIRLALIPGTWILLFVFWPHFGLGIAMLAAFAIVAVVFLTLRKLVDL